MAEEVIRYKIEIDDSELSSKLLEIRNAIDNEVNLAVQSVNQSISVPNIGPPSVPNVFDTVYSGPTSLISADLSSTSSLVSSDLQSISSAGSLARAGFSDIAVAPSLASADLNSSYSLVSSDLQSIQSAGSLAKVGFSDITVAPSLASADLSSSSSLVYSDLQSISGAGSLVRGNFSDIAVAPSLVSNSFDDFYGAKSIISSNLSDIRTSKQLATLDYSSFKIAQQSFREDLNTFGGATSTGYTLFKNDFFPEGGLVENLIRSAGIGYDDRSPYFRKDYMQEYSEKARIQLRDFVQSGTQMALELGVPALFSLATGPVGLMIAGLSLVSGVYSDQAERRDKFAETIRDIGRLGGYENATKTLGKEISSSVFKFLEENRLYDYSLEEIQQNLVDFASTGGFQFTFNAQEFKDKIKGVIENLRVVSKTLNLAQEEAAKLMGELENRNIVSLDKQGFFASKMSLYAESVGMSGSELISFGINNVDIFRQTGKTQKQAFDDLIDARLETQKVFNSTDPYSRQLQWYFGDAESAAMSLLGVGSKFMGSAMGSILSYGLLGGGNLGMHYQDLLMSASNVFSQDPGNILGSLFVKDLNAAGLSNEERIMYMYKSALDLSEQLNVDPSKPTNLMGLIKMLNPNMSEQEIMLSYKSMINLTKKEAERKKIIDRVKKGETSETIFSDEYAEYYLNALHANDYGILDVLEAATVDALDFVGTYTGIKYVGYGFYGMGKAAGEWVSRVGQSIGDAILNIERFRYEDLIEGASDEALEAFRDYDQSKVKKRLEGFNLRHTTAKIETKDQVRDALKQYELDENLSKENKKFLNKINNNLDNFNSYLINYFDNINVKSISTSQKLNELENIYNKVGDLTESEISAIISFKTNLKNSEGQDFSAFIKQSNEININKLQEYLEDLDSGELTVQKTNEFFKKVGEEIFYLPGGVTSTKGYYGEVVRYLEDLRKSGKLNYNSENFKLLNRNISYEEAMLLDNSRSDKIVKNVAQTFVDNLSLDTRTATLFNKSLFVASNIQQNNRGEPLVTLSLYDDQFSKAAEVLKNYEDTNLYKEIGYAVYKNFKNVNNRNRYSQINKVDSYMKSTAKFIEMGFENLDQVIKFEKEFGGIFKEVDTKSETSFSSEQIKEMETFLKKSTSSISSIRDDTLRKNIGKYLYQGIKSGDRTVLEYIERKTGAKNLTGKVSIEKEDINFLSDVVEKNYTKSPTTFEILADVINSGVSKNPNGGITIGGLTVQLDSDREERIMEFVEAAKSQDIKRMNEFISDSGNAALSEMVLNQFGLSSADIKVASTREIVQSNIKDMFGNNKDLLESVTNRLTAELVNTGSDVILRDKERLKRAAEAAAKIQTSDDLFRVLTTASETSSFIDKFKTFASEEAFQKDERLKKLYGSVDNYRNTLFNQNKEYMQLTYLESISTSAQLIKEHLLAKK